MTKDELRKSLYFVCQEREKLQDEIERLRDLCDRYEEEHNSVFRMWEKSIKRNRRIIEDIEFCLVSINQERKLSTDGRTRKEMTACVEVLNDTLKVLKGEDYGN